MTYLDKELSVEDGQPVELYKFFNLEESFLYTSGQNEVVFNNQTYIPEPIKRDSPDLRDVTSKRSLSVLVPIANLFARRYIVTVPATTDRFELYRYHTTDGGTPEVIQYFSGLVSVVQFKGAEAIIAVENAGTILDRVIPQQTSRNPCNHILYDAKCGVSDTSFAIVGVVSAISPDGLLITLDTGAATVPATGNQLTAQLAADPTYFNAGFLSRGSIELRMVRGTVDTGGNTADLTLLFPFQTIALGTPMTMFAGCDHQLPTCNAKFSNAARYGGFPFVPLKNPFAIGVN